jgi:hypothetical protein
MYTSGHVFNFVVTCTYTHVGESKNIRERILVFLFSHLLLESNDGIEECVLNSKGV